MSLILSSRADGRPGPLLATLMVLVVLAGCADGDGSEGGGEDRLQAVASFYPLAEATARVGGEAVRVENLTPPGAEPHDLDLTPDQVETLEDADLVVVLGGGFQPAVERVADRRDGPTVEVLAELGIDDADDPHVWLDPTQMAAVAERLADHLSRLAPSEATGIRNRARSYADELVDLDRRFRSGLTSCESRTLVVQHEAFGWLTARYDLDQEGISGVLPEQEPNPRRLAQLIDLVRDRGVTVVFTEPLVDPAVARTLAREAGVDTAVLNPIEGRTEAERDAGETYVSLMDANLDALRRGLRCGS